MKINRNGQIPLVVVGAGAAGIMASIFASSKGSPVMLLERTADGGRKILISGGGRCNILPNSMEASQFTTESSTHSLRHILRSWPLDHQKQFFERAGIELSLEPETGKLFPATNSARFVRDQLLQLAIRQGVKICFGRRVTDLEPERQSRRWQIHLSAGAPILAGAVVLASGGLSVPSTGSDGVGLEIIRRLGHLIHNTYPALTPLTMSPPRHAALAGVSAKVRLTAPGKNFMTQGGLLFTHKGYSGPAILDMSHLAVQSRQKGGPLQRIQVQWDMLDPRGWDRLLQNASGPLSALLRRHVPVRLAQRLLTEAAIEGSRSVAQLRREERHRLAEVLGAYELPWNGDEGYKKAEVTGGGVVLDELEAGTLQSRIWKGLFLCGEILDAFGPIGGYNFLWAWVTGRAAGLGAADYLRHWQ